MDQLLTFKFLIVSVLLVIKRMGLLIQISTKWSGVVCALHHLFSLECIESSEKNDF